MSHFAIISLGAVPSAPQLAQLLGALTFRKKCCCPLCT